jgi:curli biogenesis system outer membrane secretion channel CsgG
MQFGKSLRVSLPAAALALSLGAPDIAAQGKPRVAVLAFENNTTLSILGSRLGFAAADELTTQLVKTGEFSVIERQQIDAVLAEQKLGMSGAVDAATAARIGKLLGAQAVIVGSITQFSLDRKSAGIGPLAASYTEAESMIDARIVNTTTGEIVAAVEGSGKKRFGGAAYKNYNFERDMDAGVAQEALRPAVEKAVERILESRQQLAEMAGGGAMGQVVGVRGADFYIDRGQNTGLKPGQRFEVLRVVDRITDASGNVLDEVVDKVGELEVTRVLSQSAICKVVEGEAKEGDRIRPKSGG